MNAFAGESKIYIFECEKCLKMLNMTRILSILLLVAWCILPVTAQQVTVSPVPQNITWGSKAFSRADATFKLTSAQTTDAYAVQLIEDNLSPAAAGNVTIVVGKAGEEHVEEYAAKIPTRAEGYYLSVTSDRIVVAGRDDAGTYYGVQSLLQILNTADVMSVEIKDFPSCSQRGVIEGFYGNPWSDADRRSQFDFYGKNKMNVYVYGPKDDPYHRTRWRENYPAAEGAVIRGLAEAAKRNHVDFVWAIHTGGSISNSESDFQAVVNKLENVYSLGVRNFSIFFDDFGSADADLQSAECNYVWDNFVLKHDDVSRLSMCPTKYNAAYAGWNSSDSYLNGLGEKLREGIEIMWTGNSVVDMINNSDVNFFKTATGRYPFIWLNYPVNDYCIGHMLMGKFYGNDSGDNMFGQKMSAFAANPMEYAEASKVALYGVADYSWNMKAYDAQGNWERAIRYLMPDNADAFHVFCEHNVDLGSTVHGLRRDGESPNFNTAASRQEIRAQYDLMVSSADALLADTYNPSLITEITPWLLKMKYMGQRGQKEIEMWDCIDNGNTALFIQDYKDIQAIQALEDELISRNFEGTIKSARPVVADNKVAPYLKQQLIELVIEYKKRYSEGWENFPQSVLESGNYYIKFNGKYLYNKNASSTRTGDYPVWADGIDDAQPQKCEWTIQQDTQTGRFKIVNTQDGRYLNEKGEFWASATSNPYDPEWHSYDIYRVNGKYAIQGTSKAGRKFLGASPTRMVQTTYTSLDKNSNPTLRFHDAIFEIVPVGAETEPEYPQFDQKHSYFIIAKNVNGADRYLTATAAWTALDNLTFKTKYNTTLNKPLQRWLIVPDATYGRWKIALASDQNKFSDEVGRMNKNIYYSDWNSMALYECNGNWAIEGVTRDAAKFWGVTEETTPKIQWTDKSLQDSYIFQIVEADPFEEAAVEPSTPEGMVCVFAENFDTDGTPDAARWSNSPRKNAAWNRFLSDDPRVVYVQDGALHCKVIPNDDKTSDNVDMLSGGIETKGKFSFRYGRAEARIKTNPYTGNFPAFWLMPQNNTFGGWPASGEIDIWETINQTQEAHGSVHTNWTYTLGKGGNTNHMAGIDYTMWHVYSVEWTANKITWYVDGNKMWSYSKSTSQSDLDQLQWPFDYPFYIILNQSVGNGSWAASPDKNHTYETLFDWVRVYQNPSDVTGVMDLEGSGDAAGDSTEIYDLTGRRMSDSFRGIAIVNGNKVVR